ncbi:MAG TPA: hypothetical protein VHR66_19610 [Gemmataceae bacterium]|jgi:hypothetical protein|nr:hypothetical protein [Gemmataceae bacterium]
MTRTLFPTVAVLTLAVTCCSVHPVQADDPASARLPFAVEWEEVKPKTPLPGLQSYCVAAAGDNWLVFAGRVAGLHGFNPTKGNFPRPTANVTMFLIDPKAAKVLGQLDVTTLGPELGGPLSATNVQWVQDGDTVYAVGGYGMDLTTKNLVTFDTAIRFSVSKVAALLGAGEVNSATYKPLFAVAHDTRLKITGGELKKFGDNFLLVFGQTFDGEYSPGADRYNRLYGEQQQYSQKVRAFNLGDDLTIKNYALFDGGFDTSLPYNRRDLNVVDVIRPDGTPGLQVYGGVFKAGQVAGHTTPIEIDVPAKAPPAVKVKWVKTYDQALSHYDCAYLTVFDPASQGTFTTLFGGISQYYYDRTNSKLIRDKVDLTPPNIVDGLPFIKTASVLRRDAAGAYAQFILPADLPGYIGSEARFVPLPAVKAFPNGVLDLSKLSGRTLVGYMYGGIESNQPYGSWPTGKTNASSRLFRICITPGGSPAIPMPPLPAPTPLEIPPTR